MEDGKHEDPRESHRRVKPSFLKVGLEHENVENMIMEKVNFLTRYNTGETQIKVFSDRGRKEREERRKLIERVVSLNNYEQNKMSYG